MYLHSDTVSMISSNENLIMGLLCLLAVDIPNDLKQAVVIYASPPPSTPSPLPALAAEFYSERMPHLTMEVIRP